MQINPASYPMLNYQYTSHCSYTQQLPRKTTNTIHDSFELLSNTLSKNV